MPALKYLLGGVLMLAGVAAVALGALTLLIGGWLTGFAMLVSGSVTTWVGARILGVLKR